MQKCAAAFLLHITFCVLTCQILSTEQLNAVVDHGLVAIRRNARCQPVSIIACIILTQSICIRTIAELNVVGFRTGVRRKEEVGELAGIGIIAFKLIQPTHRLHANVVIGMGEQLIAILIGARNGGSFAVKGQGRKVIGKAAEAGTAAVLAAEDTGDAAVLPQPAGRETDRASTVTIPRTFFIIRMEPPPEKSFDFVISVN